MRLRPHWSGGGVVLSGRIRAVSRQPHRPSEHARAYDPGVADIDIPQHLIDAQIAADKAFNAIRAHQQAVGKPALEWTEEENAEHRRLQAAAIAAADARRAAVLESGLETEHGSFALTVALQTAKHAQAAESAG